MDTLTLRALKGAPLSTLIALTILRHAGPIALSELTGYDRKTTAQALRTLERMGFTQAEGRYDAYRLTNPEQQLPLWTPAELSDGAHIEGENLPLPCSSSSGSSLKDYPKHEDNNHNGEGENLPLPSRAARHTGDWLAACTGLTQKQAIHKFAALEAGGATWPEYELNARRWLTFALDHDSIKNKGAFILSRLSQWAPRDTPHHGPPELIRHLQGQCKEDPHA